MPEDRRGFLRTAAGVAATAVVGSGRVSAVAQPMPPDPHCPGILKLRLRAPRAELDGMRRFYADVLGLSAEADDDDRICVRAGGTTIVFDAAPDDDKPYYHFAFNIPENKLASAKKWLAPRCPLIKRPDGSDEYHFATWNAHAFYFNDPAGNLLEFIARHNLPNADEGEFTSRDILYASEIALVVDDVAAAATAARDRLGVEVFAGSQSEQFAAMGDDHRLLIIVKRGRTWNSGHGRTAEVWPVRAEIGNPGPGRFESEACRFEVIGA